MIIYYLLFIIYYLLFIKPIIHVVTSKETK